MNISSVGQHPSAGVVMDPPASKGHHGSRCGCDGVAGVSPEQDEAPEMSPERADRHHHGHGEGHERHGNGFGFGHYAAGIGHFIREQLHAARREVAAEQVEESATGLTAEVAGVIAAAGQQDGLAAAQEAFNTAIQDAVERFNSGEIGRRHVTAEFRAAYEGLVEAVRSTPPDDLPASESPETITTSDAGTPEPAVDAAEDGSLAQSLGQVFDDFMQGLRTGFAAVAGRHEFTSPDNRARILESLVEQYRELGSADDETGDTAVPDTIDQLA